jgi:hypothetical protein
LTRAFTSIELPEQNLMPNRQAANAGLDCGDALASCHFHP